MKISLNCLCFSIMNTRTEKPRKHIISNEREREKEKKIDGKTDFSFL